MTRANKINKPLFDKAAVLVLLTTLFLAAGAFSASRGLRQKTAPGPRMFRLPVLNPGGKLFSGPRVNGKLDLITADHEPTPGRNGVFARASCRDYLGRPFPHCYGNHKGSDFILKGGFRAMDRQEARVVAAASGTVIKVEDGHYDRCRASLIRMGVSCRGHEKKPNYVWIKHDNGYISRYYHFKKNTVAVKEGQRVECGDFLGLVGSSGESSLPHLHFDVVDPDGFFVDPFSKNPADSMWVEQEGPYGLPAERCTE